MGRTRVEAHVHITALRPHSNPTGSIALFSPFSLEDSEGRVVRGWQVAEPAAPAVSSRAHVLQGEHGHPCGPCRVPSPAPSKSSASPFSHHASLRLSGERSP